MKQVGIHIRLTTSLSDVIEKARRLQVPFFQTFLVAVDGKRIKPTPQEIQGFKYAAQHEFQTIFIHASYWVNLAGKKMHGMRTIEHELKLAQQLSLNRLVLHPGSATNLPDKNIGIQLLTERLNYLSKRFPEFNIILENTAHARKTIGSDINDFQDMFSLLNPSKQFSLCIDTAHAYSYGYDLATTEGQQKFLNQIEKTVGLDKIELIHLNDTEEKLGSKIDKHAIPGTGNIGAHALKQFINLPALQHKPIILELPLISEEEELKIITMVNNWRNNP